MIKLIASDMDGTLLDENSNLHSEFFTVLDRLNEKGIKFIAASGRQYYTLYNNFNKEDNIIYVAENGTYVVYSGQEIYSNTIKWEKVLRLIDESRKLKDVSIVLCGKKSAYYEDNNSEFISEVKKYYHRNKKVVDLTKVEDDILKIALCDFRGSKENSYKVLAPSFNNDFIIAVSGKIWIDFMNIGVNKGEAIKLIQKKFNIGYHNTMVFGDYYNDLEMLQSAYYSYAMENAPEDLKEYARFVAKSNKDNGVIEKIKEVVAV